MPADPAGPSGDRARSFGAVADDYERWRPGPSPAVADWLLPAGAQRVVDVGAGTGALSRLLVGRVPDLVAVEPDARMREVLTRNVPDAAVLEGQGERIPLDAASADVVVVSSAWHWMDVDATAAEIARVLRPGGVLGVVWSGVDPTGWFADLRARVEQDQGRQPGGLLGALVDREDPDEHHVLRLPAEAPFEPVEHEWLTWVRPMTAEQLLGMLGTFSGVIVLPEAQRRQIMDEAGEMLRRYGGLDGDAVLDVPFRASCWRAVRTDAEGPSR